MTENKYSAALSRVLKSQGCMVYPLIASEKAPAGWPDKLVWSPIWDGLIEVKGPYTVVEEHQKFKLRELDRRRPRSAVMVRFLHTDEAQPLGQCLVRVTQFYGRDQTVDVIECKQLRLIHELKAWREMMSRELGPD